MAIDSCKTDHAAISEQQVQLAEWPCMLDIKDYYNTPILDPEDLVTHLSCDVNALHEIHDLRAFDLWKPNKHTLRGSINDLINSYCRGLNTLDLGNVTTPTPSWLSKLTLNSISAGLIEGSGYPTSDTHWTTCATQRVYTRLHYDTGKYGTYVTCTCGAKLWIVADELPSEGLADFNPDESKIQYVYYVLERGSTLNPSKAYIEHEEQASTYTTLTRDTPLLPDIKNMASLLAMTALHLHLSHSPRKASLSNAQYPSTHNTPYLLNVCNCYCTGSLTFMRQWALEKRPFMIH
ncbi:hypothetical protein M422DRAFT_55600 [Sphaerobolus stellatus SS14]|uniref:Unplaced genomic scaffold SPHSTscaffold_300, whole genome shotgun sequence n=1 Tax=Sphaerobolus stellatus (strain SS14) TaxID=990650 RepID=A0A0C9ULY9_SPHS4|nr:hypothetical protein M422DRAFT_55600 [Sphaerobolus stellatus SS14]